MYRRLFNADHPENAGWTLFSSVRPILCRMDRNAIRTRYRDAGPDIVTRRGPWFNNSVAPTAGRLGIGAKKPSAINRPEKKRQKGNRVTNLFAAIPANLSKIVSVVLKVGNDFTVRQQTRMILRPISNGRTFSQLP
jgi:hypothetical protein